MCQDPRLCISRPDLLPVPDWVPACGLRPCVFGAQARHAADPQPPSADPQPPSAHRVHDGQRAPLRCGHQRPWCRLLHIRFPANSVALASKIISALPPSLLVLSPRPSPPPPSEIPRWVPPTGNDNKTASDTCSGSPGQTPTRLPGKPQPLVSAWTATGPYAPEARGGITEGSERRSRRRAPCRLSGQTQFVPFHRTFSTGQ